MENWFFILVGLVVMAIFLNYKFFKLEKHYKEKSGKIQEKIEDLKCKNVVLEEKKTNTLQHSSDVNQIVKEVSDLHYLVMKKYLK